MNEDPNTHTNTYVCSKLPVWLSLQYPKLQTVTSKAILEHMPIRMRIRLTMTLRRLVQFPMLSTEHEIFNILDMKLF